jgi:hypothetical protein
VCGFSEKVAKNLKSTTFSYNILYYCSLGEVVAIEKAPLFGRFWP